MSIASFLKNAIALGMARLSIDPFYGNVNGLLDPYGQKIRFPQVIAQTGIPMIIPPGNGLSAGVQFSGTIGAFNIVGAQVMPVIFPACFMYFPANQIAGTSNTAGFYYVVMTSTTAGRVYNNKYTSDIPAAPANPAAFSGVTNGAWLTQTTADVAFVMLPVCGGSMGPNGSLEVSDIRCWSNTGNNKLGRCYLGNTQFAGASGFANTDGASFGTIIRNVNNESVNMAINSDWSYIPYRPGPITFGAISTMVNQDLMIYGSIAANTDYHILIGCSVIAKYAP